jgi:hypothetical protein
MIGSGENSSIQANKDKFPLLSGINLEGKKHELPKDFIGELNLIAIGFEREHQEAINTWIKVADELIEKNPKIKFYEVPLIYELGTFSRTWINNGMRLGIQNEIARKRTVTVFTNRDKFFEIMDMKGDKIYTLLLDKDGKILWRAEGLANQKNIESLQKILKKIK